MSRPIPAGDDVEHFDPELADHRAWLLAVRSIWWPISPMPWRGGECCGGSGQLIRPGSLHPRTFLLPEGKGLLRCGQIGAHDLQLVRAR
jgi:hypothetical protein